MSKKRKEPKRRDPVASTLTNPLFKQRIVRDKKRSPKCEKDSVRRSLQEE